MPKEKEINMHCRNCGGVWCEQDSGFEYNTKLTDKVLFNGIMDRCEDLLSYLKNHSVPVKNCIDYIDITTQFIKCCDNPDIHFTRHIK